MTPSPIDPEAAKLEPLDQAVADRLARLRTMPVDLTALRHAVEARIAPPARRESRPSILRIFTPMRAVAASLLVGGLVIALIVASSAGPVLASADQMARIHEEVVSHEGHAAHGRKAVNSIEAANQALAAENPGAPAVPALGNDHVMSCCVHSVGRKKMSCVSMMLDGVEVSMAVADAADVKMPATEAAVVDGVTYQLQSARGVNMVMTERGGRWVCLMGKVPTTRLIDLAKQLRF